MRAVLRLFLVLLAADAAKSAESIKVRHTPKLPKTGERIVVRVDTSSPPGADGWQLQYQVVEPGNYIDLQDPAYTDRWTGVELAKAANSKAALTAELPPELQRHRSLIRYRVYSPAAKAVVAPAPDDAQRNFAYFVYDGIPAWQGAINPKGSEKERRVATFDSQVMRSVQAYHLIGKQRSVENVTWYERNEGSEYKYTATLVADGKAYDHVRFRARGGAWRYAMGKNMWKIDFLKGHHLEARDNWGQKYPVKWGKLNLGACIQQGDYGMRGEHGLLEAVSCRLFNLAGVAAPRTHWVQLRIIDSVEESPADHIAATFGACISPWRTSTRIF